MSPIVPGHILHTYTLRLPFFSTPWEFNLFLRSVHIFKWRIRPGWILDHDRVIFSIRFIRVGMIIWMGWEQIDSVMGCSLFVDPFASIVILNIEIFMGIDSGIHYCILWDLRSRWVLLCVVEYIKVLRRS